MSYLSWHFKFVPNFILHIGRNYIIFLYHYFSISILSKTLFAHWKRTYQTKKTRALSPSEVFDRLSFNITSRIIGALIRLVVITTGLVMIVVVITTTITALCFWIIIPVITYPLYLKFKEPRADQITNEKSAKVYIQKLASSEFGRFFFTRLMLDLKELLKNIEPNILITQQEISPLLIPNSKKLQVYFQSINLAPKDLHHVYSWYIRIADKQKRLKKFWELENLLKIPSIGKSWVYGFTPTLDKFTTDLSQQQIPFGKFIGRIKEIKEIEKTLIAESENNCIIISEPGVGAHPLLIHLAHLVQKGQVYPQLEGKRMIRLDLERVFANSADISQHKGRLTAILDEARIAGNIILVIDQFDRFITSRRDRLDLSDIFAHELSNSSLQIIAMVNHAAYEQFLRPNTALIQHFETIEIKQQTAQDTLLTLESILPAFEKKDVIFSYQALKALVTLADRYIKDKPFPEKAIDLLDSISTEAKTTKRKIIITPKHVEAVISKKTKTPISLSDQEKKILINLEKRLHTRIINQEEAVKSVSDALRRARTDVAARKQKPIGVFLFLGPTGVGKTETAKALAHEFFGKQSSITRFDMSEFQETDSISRFIGDFKTGAHGVFAQALHENPYTLLLLDEFEKASKNLLHLFLAAFDEGYITDAFGKKIYLTNTIIIATSNAGSEFIRQQVRQKAKGKHLQEELIDYVQRKNIFTPELLNRFDNVVVFKPLTPEHTEKILDLFIVKLQQKFKSQYSASFILRQETRKTLLEKGFSQHFGGRQLKRAITKYVENPLSIKILHDEVKRGDKISI